MKAIAATRPVVVVAIGQLQRSMESYHEVYDACKAADTGLWQPLCLDRHG